MSAPRRRRKFTDDEESHPDERWMASYMDMVTVLMCMFIVLFAMSTVDANKFEQLRNSLATGFGAVNVGKIDTATGVVVPANKADQEAQGFTDVDRAKREVKNLKALRDKLHKGLKQKNLDTAVRFKLDERGLTIRLVGSQTFFKPDRAVLTAHTLKVLDSIGPTLANTKYGVSVEGHTAKLPETYLYPLDWELSSERAVNVVRNLVDKSGMAAVRISAVGYGQSRPLRSGSTASDLAANRRVDIVVLSAEPDKVRALIPQIAAGS